MTFFTLLRNHLCALRVFAFAFLPRKVEKSQFSLVLMLGLCTCACQPTPPVQQVQQELAATEPTTQPMAVPALTVANVSHTLANVRAVLDSRMVFRMTDPASGKTLQWPPNQIVLAKSDNQYNATGYPSAVIYAGMLAAADATGDKAYSDFVANRFQFFADTEPRFENQRDRRNRNPYGAWARPVSLDSCGAMGAAFIKARRAGLPADLKPLIDRFADFASHRQFRLEDGTLARRRPFPDSLWGDDMYMSVPLLAQMGALTKQTSYYDDAARQITQMSARLFVPSTGLYTHGWNAETGDNQPHYYWGRANGWCAMAMVELLEVLPADHPQRAAIISQLKAHARGLASTQSGTGLWHQLLDRPDSYPETSCSAMFTFAIARAVNRGWLDSGAYGAVAIAGWNGVTSRIDAQGHVLGTCVGTSYAADYPYYYNRKFTDDQHGYGPVLLAGSEIIKLLKNPALKVRNEAGAPVMVYTGEIPASQPDR